MRILLTGSTGFLGRNIISQAASYDVTIYRAVRQSAPGNDNEIILGPYPWGTEQFQHALAVSEADAVIHCMGSTIASDAWKYFQANTMPTANLISAISAQPVPSRVILIGSAAEYGSAFDSSVPVKEDTACQPRSDYGISKYAQTLLGVAAEARGLPVLTARLFNPVGSGMPSGLALPSFARRIASSDDGSIRVGNIDVYRDFIDVSDASRILLELAQMPHFSWPLVNVCSGRPVQLKTILKKMISLANKPMHFEIDPALVRSHDVSMIVGDTSRLQEVGLRPEAPDFERIIPAILREAGKLKV